MLSTQNQKKRPKTKRLESGEDKVNNEELLWKIKTEHDCFRINVYVGKISSVHQKFSKITCFWFWEFDQ